MCLNHHHQHDLLKTVCSLSICRSLWCCQSIALYHVIHNNLKDMRYSLWSTTGSPYIFGTLVSHRTSESPNYRSLHCLPHPQRPVVIIISAAVTLVAYFTAAQHFTTSERSTRVLLLIIRTIILLVLLMSP